MFVLSAENTGFDSCKESGNHHENRCGGSSGCCWCVVAGLRQIYRCTVLISALARYQIDRIHISDRDMSCDDIHKLHRDGSVRIDDVIHVGGELAVLFLIIKFCPDIEQFVFDRVLGKCRGVELQKSSGTVLADRRNGIDCIVCQDFAVCIRKCDADGSVLLYYRFC